MRSLSRLTLLLSTLLLARPGLAQDPADYHYENLVFTGVGVQLGTVFPARSEPALSLNVRADLGLLGPALRISPGITFWASELRDSEVARMENRIEAACEQGGVPCPGIELGTVEISDLSLNVDAHYLWTTDFAIEPYAGAGVSLHLLNGRGDFIDDTFVEELLDAVAPGLDLVGGLELPLGASLRLMGEARGVLTGNTRYISLAVGASWTLPAAMQRPVSGTPAEGRR